MKVLKNKFKHKRLMRDFENSIDYFSYFDVSGGNKKSRKRLIHEFKSCNNLNNLNKSIKSFCTKILKNQSKEFLKTLFFISIPSSCGINDYILKQIKTNYTDISIDNKVLKKGLIKNINFSMRYEKSPKTLNVIKNIIHSLKKTKYEKIYQQHLIPRSYRKYIRNFLKINNKKKNIYKDKNIILIDDTIDEGATIIETKRILNNNGLNVIYAFIPIKYSSL